MVGKDEGRDSSSQRHRRMDESNYQDWERSERNDGKITAPKKFAGNVRTEHPNLETFASRAVMTWGFDLFELASVGLSHVESCQSQVGAMSDAQKFRDFGAPSLILPCYPAVKANPRIAERCTLIIHRMSCTARCAPHCNSSRPCPCVYR